MISDPRHRCNMCINAAGSIVYFGQILKEHLASQLCLRDVYKKDMENHR